MVRRITTIACWIVLVLSAGVWVASEFFYVHKQLFGVMGVAVDDLWIARGSVSVELNRPPGTYLDRVFAGTWERDVGPITDSVTLPRLWLPRVSTRFGFEIVAPLWIPALLSLAVITAPRWLPRDPGRCAKCRYDISATTLAVCPECGTPIAGRE